MFKKIIHALTWKRKLLRTIEQNGYDWQSVFNDWQASADKITEKQLRKIGAIIYENLLVRYLSDLNLSPVEMVDMTKFADFCKIEKMKISEIKLKYSAKSIQALSLAKLSDNILTSEEKAEMYDLAEKLEVSKEVVDKINSANALIAYQAALKLAVDDRRLSDTEEQEIKVLAQNLGLVEEIVDAELNKIDLAYFKLLQQVESGHLPVVNSSAPMQAKEICHYIGDASRLESKVVTVGYTGRSSGVSIRIAKGVSYRVGAQRSQPIKKEITTKYPGTLIVTSKRIIFTAVQKGFSIPIGKLTNFEPYSDGIGLQKDSHYYLMQFDRKQTELLGLIITGAVNKL